MNAVPFDAALFAVIAIAALAFCLGFVVASVMHMRPRRDDQAAPPTAVRTTATGRPSRWPAEPTNSTGPDSDGRNRHQAPAVDLGWRPAVRTAPKCACGYVRCICTGSGSQ